MEDKKEKIDEVEDMVEKEEVKGKELEEEQESG